MAGTPRYPSWWSAPILTPPRRSAWPKWASALFSLSLIPPRRFAANWSKFSMVRLNSLFCLGLLWPALLAAQQTPDLNRILERLDKLEEQNHALTEQVRQLQTQLAALRPDAAQGGATSDAAQDTAQNAPTV